MLDLISNGRAEFGIGEGATRLELGGFDIPAKEKRAMALEAAEQIANMMVMEPYPGFEGRSFKMPCRNVMPKPVQKPHPPMWMACTNRDTIKVAAQPRPRRAGLLLRRRGGGAHLGRHLLRHHQERGLRAARPQRQRQHRHGLGVLAARTTAPRRSGAGRKASSSSATPSTRSSPTTPCPAARSCGSEFQDERASGALAATDEGTPRPRRRLPSLARHRHAGRLRARTCAPSRPPASTRSSSCSRPAATAHEHICASLELFAARGAAASSRPRPTEREARKAEELAPFIAKALARKKWMAPLADADIPVVRASVAKPAVNQSAA